jgi:hypothetical protein
MREAVSLKIGSSRRRLWAAGLSLVVSLGLIGAVSPPGAYANHVQNWGHLACNNLAVGSSTPVIYLRWTNLSIGWAKPYLYRYTKTSSGWQWQYRGTGVWAQQYSWGSWYRADNNARISGWTWGNQRGWYAIRMRVQSYYTQAQAWGPTEYGWTDTYPFDAVGNVTCYVRGTLSSSRRAPEQPPHLPLKARPDGAPRGGEIARTVPDRR